MKFKFNKNLDYQIEAINSIVDIFNIGENTFIERSSTWNLQNPTPIVQNELITNKEDGRMFKNVQSIQEQNKIEPVKELDSLDFSVEMETGTGKTYVYLRTILELYKKYNLKKFIILVPSVAIREGVLKTLNQTEDHFHEMYGVGYNYFAYDSQQLSQVREFAQSIDVQIMIMTIQSFAGDDRLVMRQNPDRFHGEKPIEMIAQTQPIVIMDEPQNMESDLSKTAIEDLNPLFKLRYSATHREPHNLMYRLTPVDAYKEGLVKKIEVYGAQEYDPGALIFEVREIKTERGKSPRARVVLEIKDAEDEYSVKERMVQAGEDLKRKTNNEKYEGLMVNDINAKHERVELSNGEFYQLEEQTSENKEAVFRTQIRETIKAHFDKQEELGDKMKVLSLFFIDKVDNYVKKEGLIRKIFIQEFEKLKKNYNSFKHVSAHSVHAGYFAKRQNGDDYLVQEYAMRQNQEAFDLIMKDKERLLSFEEPVSFIFSHSALGEGWDNPNVFQICTLNESRSTMKKRQEIGRGLRLPLDIEGNRVYDSKTNILTVVANENYKDFVASLQTEYDEAGYDVSPPSANARKPVNVTFDKSLPVENKDFQKLWEKIRKRTKFNIDIDVAKLVNSSIDEINKRDVSNLVVRVEKVIIDFDDEGSMKTIYEGESVGERIKESVDIGNIVKKVAEEVGITRSTVLSILEEVDNLNLIFVNPEEYQRMLIVIIKSVLNELLVNEGLKYTPVKDVWEIELFEDFKSYQTKTIKSEKSIYNRVVFDSKGEREFAESLESNPQITLFTKLPPKFVIDTPLGTYNPDWAIVRKQEGTGKEKLYLVRETKFVDNLENLRPSERQKILAGKKHFAAIDVDFRVVQKKDLSDLI